MAVCRLCQKDHAFTGGVCMGVEKPIRGKVRLLSDKTLINLMNTPARIEKLPTRHGVYKDPEARKAQMRAYSKERRRLKRG